MASIRKRQWRNGKGEVKTAWAVDFFDARGARQRRQFPTKREADAFRIEVEGQLRSGTFRAEFDRVTVAIVAQSYLESLPWAGRAGRADDPAPPRNGRGPIAQPRPACRVRCRASEAGPSHCLEGRRLSRPNSRRTGVSAPLTRKILAVLARVLAHAVSRDLIAVNAARGVKVIARRDQGSKKIVPPSKRDLRALLDHADDETRIVVLFAAASGLRAGELWALRWRHLDFAAEEVAVATRVDRFKVEDTTKTEAGVRTVPIGSSVMTALKAWRLRSRFSKFDDRVFPNARGGYTNHDNFAHRNFRPLCRKARVAGVNWHGLRHFAISTWIEAGLSPKAVQVFAGHASLEMTMDRYGHLFPAEEHKAAMDKIASALI